MFVAPAPLAFPVQIANRMERLKQWADVNNRIEARRGRHVCSSRPLAFPVQIVNRMGRPRLLRAMEVQRRSLRMTNSQPLPIFALLFLEPPQAMMGQKFPAKKPDKSFTHIQQPTQKKDKHQHDGNKHT